MSFSWKQAKTTRKVFQGTGRRTIGEVAGHEINLEIEGVQDGVQDKINE